MPDDDESGPPETDLPAVVIRTNVVTVEISGPHANPETVYGLWDRVYTRIQSEGGIEAGGMGFAAERAEPFIPEQPFWENNEG